MQEVNPSVSAARELCQKKIKTFERLSACKSLPSRANERMLRFHLQPSPRRTSALLSLSQPFSTSFQRCPKEEKCLSGKSCVLGWLFWPSLAFRCGDRGRHHKFYQYLYPAGMSFSRPNPYRPGVFSHPRSSTSFPQVLGPFSMAKTQSPT